MSESTTVSTGLTSQYAAQVASDIEHNVKEQERISADIAALQEQLTTLQHDHSVLVNVQQALGIAPASARPAATRDSTSVPAPRKKTPGGPEGGKRTRTKKAATGSQGPTAVKKSAPKKPASKAADAKEPQLTLVELVRRHLTEQGEPRSAAEVATALDTAHAERGIKTTVVRTTLENLVAKNQAQRTKQGSSVYYTAPATTEQTAAAASDAAQAE
nr:BlaI/MecI/CopY family transcriptional regulator [Streptomyces sp. CoT10]